MMTRKDYIMVARVLRDARPHPTAAVYGLWETLRDELALEFESDNPRFVGDEFKAICDN